ncbi:hypothetical protein RSP673_012310 [Ralstonia solanacearum P673]|uniref:hypothetical protein n=1 Tax=Ralstonia solanacearum TaxID=305 RepID=UPI00202A0AAB|nr:hypothetical protein [Ralstonia solanacearum]MCL9849888.1 hypothetical protein [Ralstonia solanacearum]MCL9856400.1 hypothetical protein [Ralstonia solanacearum]MCL9861166.1 hypothetical protein [Ralstonia solanacearum]MCL9866076.1 hypothetical protein [Ralstonia solanacearum]MCL9870804.1 hypothetical protein [Ralstonia solanacearum]
MKKQGSALFHQRRFAILLPGRALFRRQFPDTSRSSGSILSGDRLGFKAFSHAPFRSTRKHDHQFPVAHATLEPKLQKYLARITVHAASEQDYVKLHDQMATINFVRFIVGDDGRSHALPDATYVCYSNESCTSLRDKIHRIINQTVPRLVAPLILVAQVDSAAWTLPLEMPVLKAVRGFGLI